MDNIKEKLAKWRKEELVIWVFLASGFTLFLPDAMWRSSAMLNWRNENEVYLLLVFIGALSYVLAKISLEFIEKKVQQHKTKEKELVIVQMLNKMDHTERSVLREFILRRVNSLSLPIHEPAVKNLIDSGILELSNSQNDDAAGGCFSLSLSLLARPYLSYRILGLPVGSLNAQQRESLMNARPKFLTEKKRENRTHNGKIFRLKAHIGKQSNAA